MSLFNRHCNDYMKNEINGLRKWVVSDKKKSEELNCIQEIEKQWGSEQKMLNDNQLNGNHQNDSRQNGEQYNGILQNGKQNSQQKNGYTTGENERMNSSYENKTQNGTAGNGELNANNENGHNNDSFVPVCKPGRFICRGLYTDIPHLCSETGYLIWIEPKQTMRVLFTYGDTNCDFLCYLEPEVPGVAVNYLEPNKIKHFQHFNENDYRPIQIHSGLAASINGSTGTRYSCIGTLFNTFSYAIDSENGQCFIELNVLNKKQMNELIEPISRPFKLNFRLVL
ncbi:hypothetical protein MN116_006889 [Schistosoma mekongi]|uniref:Uncharacterized protein n=1 Tax=Schistosoma mekongi TaxID=38744 RepID=A0AAE1Z816_SCHME|nr:hypothetical protein MN116_006889 [Schistosoma mekongi]